MTMNRYDHSPELVAAAGEVVRIVIRTHEGPCRPGDLDDRIMAGSCFPTLMQYGRNVWAQTPFGAALADMVERGEVIAEKDDDGWKYQMRSEP
jgi:hypothetical protein